MKLSRQTCAALLALVFILSGCSTVRLYSDVRDKQGQEAKSAWSSVDLAGVIDAERKNLDKLLQEELKTQEALAASIRDNRLRALVDMSIKQGLVDPVDEALVEVAGSSALIAAADQRRTKASADSDRIKAYAVEFEGLPFKTPSCGDLKEPALPKAIEAWRKKAPTVEVARVDYAVAQIRRVCTSGTLEPLFIAGGMGGAIARTVEQYRSDLEALAAAKASAAPLKATYEQAAAAYKAAVDAASVEGHVSADVRTTLDRLSNAADALDKAGDAFSAEFISSERLKAIGDFADAVAEGKPEEGWSESRKKAALALALIPELIDESSKSLASAKKPLALPLLMRSNHERLKLQAATKEIEARESMVRLSKESLDTVTETALQLWLASRELNSPQLKHLHSQHATKAFLSAAPDDRERMYMATIRYLDTVDRLSARRHKLEYMRLAAYHQLSLSYSEANVQQWGSLIGLTVDQVAASSAGGIRAEQISEILEALGVLWIGNGVNK